MTYEMKDEDIKAASCALIDWLESQAIIRHDAVRVLTTTVIAIVKEIAVTSGLNAKDGGRIIADIIMESLP